MRVKCRVSCRNYNADCQEVCTRKFRLPRSFYRLYKFFCGKSTRGMFVTWYNMYRTLELTLLLDKKETAQNQKMSQKKTGWRYIIFFLFCCSSTYTADRHHSIEFFFRWTALFYQNDVEHLRFVVVSISMPPATSLSHWVN